MSTKFPELFAALSAPFPPECIKTRPGGAGIKLSYITARVAQNRLDEVLGPENWRPEYEETKDGVKCSLWLMMPDGNWLAKQDGGGFAAMKDESDTEKSGYSEAFKRAAAVWGIARYLYRDGIPKYERPPATSKPSLPREPLPAPAPRAGNGDGHAGGVSDDDSNGPGIYYVLSELAFKVNDRFMAWCLKEGAQSPEKSLVKPHQLENYMGTLAVQSGRIPPSYIEGPDGKRSRTKLLKMLRAWHHKYPEEFMMLLHKHIDDKATEKCAQMGLFWPTEQDEADAHNQDLGRAKMAEAREPGSDDR